MRLQKYTHDKYKLMHKVNYWKHQDTVQQLDSAVGIVIGLRMETCLLQFPFIQTQSPLTQFPN